MSKYQFIFYILILSLAACQTNHESKEETKILNPAAANFDLENSDEKAIELADKIMEASGSRKNWDETDYLKWNFFGSRRHIWNKSNGDLIIEGLRDSFFIYMNLNELIGTVNMNGVELTDQDSLNKYLNLGKEMWINDSYWVFLPYKLKDDGVRLKYLGLDTMINGSTAEKIELTFKDVGVTPNNKYYVYADTSNYLLSQWDYYPNTTDSVPRFQIPWEDYQIYNRLRLSSSRGDKYKITELSASDTLARYFK